MSTRESLRMHEQVRFTRIVDGIPAGATGWIVDMYEQTGGVAIDLDDPDLHPDPVVDVPVGELDALEPVAST